MSTVESFVNQSPNGWFAYELADVLHAEVQDPLHDLVRADRLRRSEVAGRFLYTSADGRQARDQLRTRQTAQSVPLLTDASALQVSPDELKAAILLFYSLPDEQQRRLFAGLESIKLGHGGDGVQACELLIPILGSFGADHHWPRFHWRLAHSAKGAIAVDALVDRHATLAYTCSRLWVENPTNSS